MDKNPLETSHFRSSHWRCNFIKKEFLAQVFSFEFCEILKNSYFIEHLRKIASEIDMKIVERYHLSMFREEQIRSKRLRLFRVEPGDKKLKKYALSDPFICTKITMIIPMLTMRL